jgi:ATP-dependent exoDNAse (exonuclease V) alpha subunit
VAAAARAAAPRAGRAQRLHPSGRRAARHRRAANHGRRAGRARADARRAAPAGRGGRRRLGADSVLLEVQLRARAHDAREHEAPRGLRLDQAAAIWHVLTSPRTVEIITGRAGTGKTRVLATAASIWDGPVFGTATSQNATNQLRAAGVQVAANSTRLLADLTEGRIPPGALIVADEGSMISITHLSAVVAYAVGNGCKLVLAGDQEQLAAVEGGGAITLLADRLGYVQLAEPIRFTAAWERGVSLRLRGGDATALDEYDQRGRIRGSLPTRPWTRPSTPTWPATWPAGTCC